MRKWKQKGKCILAFLLVLAVAAPAFLKAGGSEANAMAITTDTSDAGKVANGDFEAGQVGDSVRDWSLIPMGQDGNRVEKGSSGDYTNNFTLKTAQDETAGYGRVAALHKGGTGYAGMVSEPIPVEGGKSYHLSIDYRMIDYRSTGNTNKFLGVNFSVQQLDEKGENVTYNTLDKKITENVDAEKPSSDWKTYEYDGELNARTKSVRIYCGLAGEYQMTITALFDNVVFEQSTNWTMETCASFGTLRSDGASYSQNYGLEELDGGSGYRKALRLFVKRAEGTMGGAVAYSDPIPVSDSQNYGLGFDMKIEGYHAEEETPYRGDVIFGTRVVLRYQNAKGEKINENGQVISSSVQPQQILSNTKENQDWKHYDRTVTPPKGAVSVQVGLIIGSNQRDLCKDMAYSFSNIAFLEQAVYEEYMKNLEENASKLNRKTALFVGDAFGSALAGQAASGSKMLVTDACSEAGDAAAGLMQNDAGSYEYILVSGGKNEAAKGLSAGTVTDDKLYMEGMDQFDRNTFAGILEYTFGKIAECCEQPKVVFVLTTANPTYREVAKQAAEKWSVQLVMLGDTQGPAAAWDAIIKPVQQTKPFDSYETPGLTDYLSAKRDEIVGSGLTITSDIGALERLREKTMHCPESSGNRDAFKKLKEQIDDDLEKVQGFYPVLLGATIATDDPNVLSFVALSPEKALTPGIRVKAMGILSIPADNLDPESAAYQVDARLVLGNPKVTNLEVPYTDAAREFRVYQTAWDADPYKEYTATAYVIYEAEGREYVYYSVNDHVNAVGVPTVQDGRCTKSIFGIAREAALKLTDGKGSLMNYAAIRGEGNLTLIADATEDSEVSLLDVYRLICDNKTLLKDYWLEEGGQ